MVVRGVPERLAKDAWWLDDARPRRLHLGWLLLAAVICADQLVWGVAGGSGFVVWVLVVGAATHISLWRTVSGVTAMAAWSVLCLALVPAVELVQALSVGFAVLGLLAFAALMALPRGDADAVIRAMVRLPGFGLVQSFVDAKAMRVAAPSKSGLLRVLTDWLVPLVVGAIFIGLMALANPLVDAWLLRLSTFESGFSWDVGRVLFWASAAFAIWPLLRLTAMATALGKAPRVVKLWRSGLVNARSVLRALVMFNVIFAVQSVLDAGYLWGGVALPDAMTYAEYAHRGAYPLLVTALLAGVFALVSQPYLEGRGVLRGLLYLWVAQTVLLVLSSILRLDLYVDAYGLTRLRFAALVWMVVVALGLVLMIMQMVGRQSIGWFMSRAAGLGLVALYTVSLVNVDGFVARHNLTVGKVDAYYLCSLSEGAAPELRRNFVCNRSVSTPQDWREWGFRNARLRRSLAEMKEVRG